MIDESGLIGVWQSPPGGHMISTLQFFANRKGNFARLTPSDEEHCAFEWSLVSSGTRIRFTCVNPQSSRCFLFDHDLSITITQASESPQGPETLLLSFWAEAKSIESGTGKIELPAEWCHHRFQRKML
jgi:hypothetical protein